jgi:hypothetical protein
VFWIDIVVTLLLILRIALLGPTLPRLLTMENDSSSPVGNEEEEEYLLVAEESG